LAAARSATHDDGLGAILRLQQRLTSDVQVRDRQLMATGALTTAAAHAALRQRLHADLMQLAATNREIDPRFPRVPRADLAAAAVDCASSRFARP
jgi:hypothetical protein